MERNNSRNVFDNNNWPLIEDGYIFVKKKLDNMILKGMDIYLKFVTLFCNIYLKQIFYLNMQFY
jgi:hypothetical protein